MGASILQGSLLEAIEGVLEDPVQVLMGQRQQRSIGDPMAYLTSSVLIKRHINLRDRHSDGDHKRLDWFLGYWKPIVLVFQSRKC